MKKYLLPLIVFGLFFQANIVSSQTRDMFLGVEIGGGIRSLSGEVEPLSVGEISTGLGMAAGLTLQKYISHDFSIKTSLLFAHKGARSLWQEYDTTGTPLISLQGTIDYSYISMPILFRYEFGDKVKGFVNLGPYVSSLIVHPRSRFDPVPDFTDNFSSFDWGMSSGIGGQIPITDKVLFSLEIRNDLGLRDMGDYSFFRISAGPLHTRATNLLFGVSWELE